MKVVATADLHGFLPPISPCDLLLIAGDVCPIQDHTIHVQRHWLRNDFSDWLERIPAKEIVWIAGNHDFVCQEPGFRRIADSLPGHYLQDEAITIEGVKIYGLPWVPNLPSWAFYASEPMLHTRFDDIPTDTDILLTHGPPHGILDQVGHERVGATYLMARLQRVLPSYVIFGHVHEGYGRMELGGVEFKNVAHVNAAYQPVNPTQSFRMETVVPGYSRYSLGVLEARRDRKRNARKQP